ncbi:MAG: ArnT family glycosyltransferase [Pyrinomonadaceae bacterium]
MNGSLNQERELSGTPLVFTEPRRALAAANQWVWVHRSELICALLLAAAALQMLVVVRRKNITVDEIVMIPSAYYHLVAGDFHLVNEHPPLSKFLAATPLLLIQPNEPQPPGFIPFWDANAAKFESISFWARVPMILGTVALGVLIFVIARSLFGARAAVFATALFSFEPTVLTHGRVVQTDVPAAFGYLLFFFVLYWYLQKPSWRRAVVLGGATALAILAKFSMLLTGPILVIALVALWWRAPRKQQARPMFLKHAALVTLVVLISINAAYLFNRRQLSPQDVYWVQKSFPAHAVAVSRTINAGSYILPTDFVLGIFWQLWHNNEGHHASLLGRYSRMGWWYYFPVAFALKTTLPFLLISLVSLGWATYQLIKKRDLRFLALLLPFVIYTGFVFFSRINIGVRYYLPAFPFLFILGGAFLDSLLKIRRARAVATATVCAMFLWIGVENARAFPNYLSYMNQLASKHPQWWYLSDSNVEWGDDAKELAAYLHDRGETRVQTAFLGDFFTLGRYGVESISLISPEAGEPEPARYAAVGGSFLNGSVTPEYFLRGKWPTESERVNFLDEFRRRTPEAVIGNSIYVYRMQD